MPGHRSALARNVEADRELASGELRRFRVAHEGKIDGIAPRLSARPDRDLGLAAERHGPVRSFDQRGPAEGEPHINAVERQRPGAECIGKAQAGLPAPDIRPHHHPKGLVAGAVGRNWKCKALVGLRRCIADRVRALHRSGPARDPFGWTDRRLSMSGGGSEGNDSSCEGHMITSPAKREAYQQLRSAQSGSPARTVAPITAKTHIVRTAKRRLR